MLDKPPPRQLNDPLSYPSLSPGALVKSVTRYPPFFFTHIPILFEK